MNAWAEMVAPSTRMRKPAGCLASNRRATKMKSPTKRELQVVPAAQVQISLPALGVLRDCQRTRWPASLSLV